MRLNIYQKFLMSFRPKRQYIFHYADVAERYFYLAEIQVEEFKQANRETFRDKNSHTVSSDRQYAFAFGFYILIRTCLEAIRQLNRYFENKYHDKRLSKVRFAYSKDISAIIKIANDFIKHPLNDKKRKKYRFYEPGGSDSTGVVTIHSYSTQASKKMDFPTIRPVKDYILIQKYLEELGDTYNKILS